MNDIVTKGPFRGLRFAKRQIQCSRDNFRMRCGKCGGMNFEVRVRAAPTTLVGQQTTARVAGLVCLGCRKVRAVDDKGAIQASGKVEPTSLAGGSPEIRH